MGEHLTFVLCAPFLAPPALSFLGQPLGLVPPFLPASPLLSPPWPLQTPPELGWEALSLEVCLPFQIQSLMSVGPATGGVRGGSQHVPPSLPGGPSPGPIQASP